MKRKGVVLICLALLVLLAGLGWAAPGREAQTSGTSGQASYDAQKAQFDTITMYLPGTAPPDYEKVMAKVNEKLKANVNANLTINYVGWGDFDAKFPLLLASGEPYDLIFAANWAYFADGAKKGAYMPLDKLLPVYAPGLWKDLPKDYWKGVSYQGQILAIPAFDNEISTYGFFYRDDLRVKYGLPEIKTIADFETYLNAVKKNETEIKPFVGGKFDVDLLQWVRWEFISKKVKVVSSVQGLLGYVESSPAKLYSAADPYPADKEADVRFRELLRRWNDQGLISKNMAADKTRGIEYVRNGTSAVAALNIVNAFDEYVNIRAVHPDWDFRYLVFDLNSDVIEKAPSSHNAMAVYKSAPNPEKAVMLYDQLASNKEINQLTRYGIKGVNYDINSDGRYYVPEGTDPSLFASESMSSWAWRQDRYELPRKGGFAWLEKLKQSIIVPKARVLLESGFNADTSKIDPEIAACSQIANQYGEGFSSGILDPVKDYDAMVAKLKAAGSDKIQAEIQTQWTAYLKTVGK